jgi:hypothetical protein
MINKIMIEPIKDPTMRLNFQERQQKRMALMSDVSDYIKETILYCDDEEEMIALGSVLQILSKDILTTVMARNDWKNAITDFASDVEKETDFASIRKQYRDYL